MARVYNVEALSSKDVEAEILFAIEQGLENEPSWINDIAMPSVTDSKLELMFPGAPSPAHELKLPRTVEDIKMYGLELGPKEWDIGFRVKEQDLRRDRLGFLQRRADVEIGQRIAQLWPKVISARLNNGLTEDIWDGKKLFSNTHTLGTSTVDNLYAGTTAADPVTAAEMRNYIWEVIEGMRTLTDDAGEPLQAAREFMVMVPPQLLRVASEAIEFPIVSVGSAGAEFNTLGGNKHFTIDLVENPWLTSSLRFFVFAKNGQAFVRLAEYEPIPEKLAEGSDHQVKNLEHLYFVRASRSVGAWRYHDVAVFDINLGGG